MVMNAGFWKDKKVLVTGHTGFKGSWLCLWLQSLGAEVVGYALAPPSTPSLFDVARVAQGMVSLHGDIRDLSAFQRAMLEYQPEVVIHMAAQSLVRYSYLNPVETYSTNVMGAVNVLEAVRHTPSVRAVVNVTSDKCYENREWIWGYRENEAMGGYDPYSNSKGCAELVTSAYRQSFFRDSPIAVASGRAGNVIGGGDWATDRLVPDMVRAVVERRPVLIRNPHAIRPWQHVMEPLSGYLLLARKLYEERSVHAEGWNFGPREDDARPVQWIAEQFTGLWGDGASWVLDGTDHPHEAHYLKLDCSKARSRLNWQSKWDLETSLRKIIAWHKAHLCNQDMRAFTIEQILEFQE
ncbi:MAG: CDP-glucose 4,6-dehydratase [Sideroxydans sp.]|nr:CDP-glucose 4,6-dehydratase [Sideroxydans sp.]